MKEGRKEMFYLTTHSTHSILRLYGVGHMVKDHSDSERGNPLLPHGLLFPINSKVVFICTIPQTGLHIQRPLLHQSWSTDWNERSSMMSDSEQNLKKPSNYWIVGTAQNVLFNDALNTFYFSLYGVGQTWLWLVCIETLSFINIIYY